jgi:hypothetical protein
MEGGGIAPRTLNMYTGGELFLSPPRRLTLPPPPGTHWTRGLSGRCGLLPMAKIEPRALGHPSHSRNH